MTAPLACPTPDKQRYATKEAAEPAGRRSQIGAGTILYPYACACTWWHCTKTPPPEPLSGVPDPIVAQRISALPDIAFRGIVAEDVTGKGDAAERLALRHPSNLKRWQQMIGQLLQDLCEQLRERENDLSLAAHDWRRRCASYEAALRLALSECQQRRADDTARQFEVAKARREGGNGAPSPNDLRRIAGDAAIARLIKAHHPEFTRYLAEEYARVGTPLPNRIRKYLGDHGEAA